MHGWIIGGLRVDNWKDGWIFSWLSVWLWPCLPGQPGLSRSPRACAEAPARWPSRGHSCRCWGPGSSPRSTLWSHQHPCNKCNIKYRSTIASMKSGSTNLVLRSWWLPLESWRPETEGAAPGASYLWNLCTSCALPSMLLLSSANCCSERQRLFSSCTKIIITACTETTQHQQWLPLC